jgi:hypothetical protein
LPRRPPVPFLAGLMAVLVGSCQPKQPSSVATGAVLPPPPRLVGGKILSKDRRFVYLVRWYASGAATARLDTVTLTASGAPWAIEPTQTGVEWLFSADTTLTTRPRQTVGAIENKTEFWLHPPRYGAYRILELNPFPHLKLPAVRGQTWQWEVYPPELYADAAWARWKGILRVKFRYTVAGTNQLATPLGPLSCYRVQANGTSKVGTTALEAYFHPAYGFVRLHYRNIDASRVQLELVRVDARLASSEHALEQLLEHSYKLPQTR